MKRFTIVMILLSCLVACSEEVEIQQTPIIEEEIVQNEQVRVGLNETLSNDVMEITFTDAYYTDDRNQFSDTQADKVLIIVYEYKNLGCADGLWIMEGLDYTVYDGDGYSLETYPVSKPYYQDRVSIGRSTKGSEAFAVVGDKTHYEIEIGGAIVEFDLE